MKRNEFFKQISGGRMPDIEQVRANCLNQETSGISAGNAINTRIKRQSWKKAIIIIAATGLLIFTVSAMEGIINNLTFKGFDANQVYTLSPPHLEGRELTAVWSFEIKDRAVSKYQQEVGAYYGSGKMEWVNFRTLGEAEQYLGFTPSELNYLPENGVFDKVVLNGAASDYYDKYTCHIYYKTYQDNGSPAETFALTAQYVGKNATIKVDTTNGIEKITLNNGIEALLLTEIYMPYDIPMALHRIMWIKDDIAYEVGGSFERDEMIKMAESVE
ncbi:MAG: DUF4367 domain-containing protein [Oscillospiraceae bacterium]|nr:DUF4367 domain-containing protein [Oscillospiraceae bacterium]